MTILLEEEHAGISRTWFNDASLRQRLERLIERIRERDTQSCSVAAAHLNFLFDEAVARYRARYKALGPA